MPERPVTLSDCALAFALPLSREELSADLASERPSDFASGIRRRLHAKSLEDIGRGYAKEVADAARVVAAAESLGVTVVRSATLADVTSLTKRFHVVSILAHAPSAGIEAGDIVRPQLFVETARAGTSPDQKRIRRILRCGGVELDPGAPPPSADRVAAILNAVLWTSRPSEPRRRGQLDRTHVEDAFPGAIGAAPVLELHDGLHSLGAVRAAIAGDFDGVLDLSACTSVVLAEAFKRSTEKYVVLGTRRTTHPRLRLTLYALWLEELARARGPVRFTKVVDVVADALMLAARAHAPAS